MKQSGRKGTVYIIEDDVEILSLVSTLLKRNNYDTIIDLNGDQFDVHSLPCADLYIIDINLGEKNGGALCAEIKKFCPHVPVILMSANDNIDEVAAAVKANAFLRKPFKTMQLIDKVNQSLAVTG